MGPNFPKENMNDKNFEKKKIKIEISIWQSISVPNFIQSEELQILGPNLPQNTNEKNFEKINIKIEITISTSVPNFSCRNKHMVIYLYTKFQSI